MPPPAPTDSRHWAAAAGFHPEGAGNPAQTVLPVRQVSAAASAGLFGGAARIQRQSRAKHTYQRVGIKQFCRLGQLQAGWHRPGIIIALHPGSTRQRQAVDVIRLQGAAFCQSVGIQQNGRTLPRRLRQDIMPVQVLRHGSQRLHRQKCAQQVIHRVIRLGFQIAIQFCGGLAVCAAQFIRIGGKKLRRLKTGTRGPPAAAWGRP